jgi:hypothetical protein
LYLGKALPEDAGQDASSLPEDDASMSQDAGHVRERDTGDGDDDHACEDASACDDGRRPYCDSTLKRCVRCLTDDHCADGRICSAEGECEDHE